MICGERSLSMKLEAGSKVAIVCCSNGLPDSKRSQVEVLVKLLKELGLNAVQGNYLYGEESVFSGTAKERAEDLMRFYRDPEIKAIFDISGGDIANEILPFLDFDLIGESGKKFWGYSDLTVLVNAIYARTGRESVLYQVRNLVTKRPEEEQPADSQSACFGNQAIPQVKHTTRRSESCWSSAGTKRWSYAEHLRQNSQPVKPRTVTANLQTYPFSNESKVQRSRFEQSVFNGRDDLYSFSYEFVQQTSMEGILIGGNIRCLLKLAGTPYWPDMTGKILLLEARSGREGMMASFLNQLAQMGVFEQVNGILLGTFTKMEKDDCEPDIVTLVKRYAGSAVPIAKTQEIGHGKNSKAAIIGRRIRL